MLGGSPRSTGTAQDDFPAWSPDGSHVVFLHWVYGSPDRFRIATIRSDGTDPQLSSRPEYSIRLANDNVWEAATGYNNLLRSVTVN